MSFLNTSREENKLKSSCLYDFSANRKKENAAAGWAARGEDLWARARPAEEKENAAAGWVAHGEDLWSRGGPVVGRGADLCVVIGSVEHGAGLWAHGGPAEEKNMTAGWVARDAEGPWWAHNDEFCFESKLS